MWRLDTTETLNYIHLTLKPRRGEKELKTLNPLELVTEQYQLLMSKKNATGDMQEKNRLFRRLANLLAVMEFLITVNKTH